MTSVKTLTHQSGQNSPTESWKLSRNKNLHKDLFSTGCLNIGHDTIHLAHFSCRTCSFENSIIICYAKILSCTCKYTPSTEFVFISECHDISQDIDTPIWFYQKLQPTQNTYKLPLWQIFLIKPTTLSESSRNKKSDYQTKPRTILINSPPF